MKAIVFDVYGTLFDVGSIVEVCRAMIPDPEVFVMGWCAKQLEYTFWRSLIGRYAELDELGIAPDATVRSLDEVAALLR